MKITETFLKGCYIMEPSVFTDNRGIFVESYNQKELESYFGRKINFVQDNHSISKKGVLRGLHFQKGKHAQAKLVRVIKGEVLDVVVDLRKNSPTFGEHLKLRLSDENHKMLFIPRGMAHGFLSLNQQTIFAYKCDNYYNKQAEGGIIYSDDRLGIDWEYPKNKMILSLKDVELPSLKNLQL